MPRTKFFTTEYNEGDPLRLVGNAAEANMIRSALDNMVGLGCRIDKKMEGDKLYFRFIVDGTSEDSTPEGFESSDMKVAVDSLDASAFLKEQFTGFDTNGISAARDIPVSWDILADSTDRQMRLYLEVAASGTPAESLCRTAGGALVWVDLTDTCG